MNAYKWKVSAMRFRYDLIVLLRSSIFALCFQSNRKCIKVRICLSLMCSLIYMQARRWSSILICLNSEQKKAITHAPSYQWHQNNHFYLELNTYTTHNVIEYKYMFFLYRFELHNIRICVVNLITLLVVML
jgi:hypothetical protein